MIKRIGWNSLSLILATVIGIVAMVGCGNRYASSDLAASVSITDEESPLDAEPKASGETTAEDKKVEEYFTKGVYANYAADIANPQKTYFYVFEGDGCGHVEDGLANSGMFFTYEQQENGVKFSFGNENPHEDVLIVKNYDNGYVTGCFGDTLDLVFEPLRDVDPDTFDAVNYVNAAKGEDYVFTHGYGWRVRYNPKLFEINGGGSVTTIVYTGESAGTNMITVTYTIDNKAEGAIKELGQPYGEKATYTEGTFPGTKSVPGYWVSVAPDKENSGSYMTAIARDYMDGALIFELDGHMGEDEENNMAVSDALAGIIDSLEFPYEEN